MKLTRGEKISITYLSYQRFKEARLRNRAAKCLKKFRDLEKGLLERNDMKTSECPECETEYLDSEDFCSGCGYDLDEARAEAIEGARDGIETPRS